ncbi:beta-carotene ketolase (CrtO type) [Saprolegnia diclina VS20]|uniref:Beta-carotene ketolase (CrtO type) n=1 Tax=Saprolegnia diclina (strain VS20) TaxID=1156394 RepID=T0QS89_SAPDV|nr:beta-carotene ketolase (CrtO type) [Saprolegnia diclina VS20]EQC37561.1 beta-carotene ketolase (CrtO type) [Saprolegnia diclina VS20]|eukprot:XP_008609081.1 beta-carotene ketolase (CrtO type) [Saprolegnia diclina VS20]
MQATHAVRQHLTRQWDAVIVGGGHNGLVAATYLAKAGKSVCVLEKRHLLGGAAVTEEIIPDFHFSRASYVFSLFRPQIIRDLDLYRHGLEIYPRDPSSFTPLLNGQSLLLGSDMQANQASIAQFSKADAAKYPAYNAMLDRLVDFFVPLVDELPPDLKVALGPTSSLTARMDALRSLGHLGVRCTKLGSELPTFLEFMTAPADKILNKWFESDVLKATLATDAIIGAKLSPSTPGSAYVLFHHIMGEVNGIKGTWGHVKGGMGGVTSALTKAALEAGVHLVTDATVQSIDVANGRVAGVTLASGDHIAASTVLSNASPSLTFLELIDRQLLPIDLVAHFEKAWNTESASTKINVALSALPNFSCAPNVGSGAMPHHRGTTHFEDSMAQIHDAFLDVEQGYCSKRPVIELNIPTALDASIAPEGKHIALLFVQYTPYAPKDGPWTDAKKAQYADQVFSVIEQYAPGFKQSVLGYDMLTPPDLERIFSLPRGNIFHGAMGLDQLFWLRPLSGYADYRTPIDGLYLCSAGTHPGGGVMGACGRNAANVCLRDMP